MQVPIISNNILFKKWCDKENEYMSKRLYTVKPKVNLKCPESFVFSKQKYKSNVNAYNLVFEHERQLQNNHLFNRLTKIYSLKHRENSQPESAKEKFIPNREIPVLKNNTRKWEILKITQENQLFHKRLLESRSTYEGRYMIKSGDNFYSSKSNFYKKGLLSAKQKESNNLVMERDDVKAKTNEDFFKYQSINTKQKKNLEISLFQHSSYENEKEQGNSGRIEINQVPDITSFKIHTENRKLLYKRKAFLGKLMLVEIQIFLDDKKFLIIIEPISIHSSKLFIITFEKYNDIVLMKKYYKNYEQIIADLIFDGKNIIINNDKAELKYKTRVISKSKYFSQELNDNPPLYF